MKKYIARASVLGLSPGGTFESDDPFYADIAASGIIEEVTEDGPSKGRVQTIKVVAGNGAEGTAGSRLAGRKKSQRTVSE